MLDKTHAAADRNLDISRGPGVRDGLPSAIVFDLDGTLVDSAGDLASALNELLAATGLAPYTRDEVVRFIGHGMAALVARAFEDRGRPLTHGELAEHVDLYRVLYGNHLTRSTRAYAGAAETIALLRGKGISTGICTNKDERLACAIIEALELRDHFTTIVGGAPDRPPKPSPEPLLEALAQLGARCEDVVMVGDSAADVRCARAAGVRAICVSFGYSQVPVASLGADSVIHSFAELEASCRSLYARPA